MIPVRSALLDALAGFALTLAIPVAGVSVAAWLLTWGA